MSVILLRGDARSLPLPDASVDLIVTSPPYFAQRDYRDGNASLTGQIGNEATPREYVAALLDCTREWVRVLKPAGSLFVNLGDKYSGYTNGQGKGRNFGGGERGLAVVPDGPVSAPAVYGIPNKSLMGLPARYQIGCIDDLGLIVRRDNIWHKISAVPESADDRCSTRHEYLFHITKRSRYYSAADEIREPRSGYARANVSTRRTPHGQRPKKFADAVNPRGKLPGSVWEMAATPLVVPDHIAHADCCGGRKRPGCEEGLEHHAAFPFELARKCILGWSPAGAIVADPFGGSGTAALVADVLGRTGISIDLSAGYCRLARWRTTDPAERAKALQVPKPPPVIDGQESLFEVTAS